MKIYKNLLIVSAIIVFLSIGAIAQPDDFKYQGSLNSGGQPANGNYDFEFAVFGQLSGGTQVGSTITRTNVPVVNGIFAVSLDIAGLVTTPTRFLEIKVRQAGVGSFVLLTPRQQLTTTPYSVMSTRAAEADTAETASTANTATTADTASNALALGGLLASQYVTVGDPRLTDARPPTAGSSFYIQNQGSGPQAGSFQISGNAVSGTTAVGDGSAFGPSMTFNSDPNTGLFRPAADTIGFATNGVSRMQLDSAGNLSLGATNDGSRLRINTNQGFPTITASNTSGQNPATSVLGDSDAVHGVGIGGDFYGGQYGVRSTVFGGATGNHYGVAATTNGVAGSGSFFGLYGAVNAPGAQIAYGVYGTANGAANNWAGYFTGPVNIGGPLRVGLAGPGTPNNPVWISSEGYLVVGASSIRYKTNVEEFTHGFKMLQKLRPVSFDWKENGAHDVGLVAEEVAEVEPLLVTHGADGEIQSVKYDRVSLILINTIKEQQAEIERLKAKDAEHKSKLESLTQAFCTMNKKAAVCRKRK